MIKNEPQIYFCLVFIHLFLRQIKRSTNSNDDNKDGEVQKYQRPLFQPHAKVC